MSDAPQGPGWWLASDGKWYPPQPPAPPPAPVPPSGYGPPPGYGQPPGYGPPPAPGEPYTTPQTPGVNGLAIAALVLGLLWVCGLGSILAVVFGFIALSQIKKSGQGGKGLAIAGLVLGFLGIVGGLGATAALVVTADEIVENQPNEFDDVVVTSCEASETGTVVAMLDITNDSTKRSNYFITIDFRLGGDESTELVTVNDVAPGDTTREIAESTFDRSAAEPRCRVELVERFSATG
jgi:Domain of unknown function (DUF4190)